MKILIVEDEPATGMRLKSLIEESRENAHVAAIVDSVEKSAQLLLSERYDLIFMDIQLADGLCFDIFEAVEPPCPVIFCTAFDDYALQAFKANGIDYVLKPVRRQDIDRTFNRYEALQAQFRNQKGSSVASRMQFDGGPKQRFLIRAGNRLFSIGVGEIVWFETRGRDVALRTHDGRDFYIDDTLSALERKLDPAGFFRINRQRLVAYKSIEDIRVEEGRCYISLSGEPDRILVSRDRTSGFRKWLDR